VSPFCCFCTNHNITSPVIVLSSFVYVSLQRPLRIEGNSYTYRNNFKFNVSEFIEENYRQGEKMLLVLMKVEPTKDFTKQ
jgi:hypothetical protein